MHEMKVNSLAIFIGTGECNANCEHCAGLIHRKYSPKQDGIIDYDLLNKTLRTCYEQGARALSISSSGEPTLSPKSVTSALNLVSKLREEGIKYMPINLYSNGIRIGEDKEFAENFLTQWRNLGLNYVYITVHDTNANENARIYQVKSYPDLELIIKRIHDAGLLMRANLVLNRKTINTFDKFVSTVQALRTIGSDAIAAWPIRNMDDQFDRELSPDYQELKKMEEWVEKNQNEKCKIRFLTEKSRVKYQSGQKLTLFPNGKLSNTWCN